MVAIHEELPVRPLPMMLPDRVAGEPSAQRQRRRNDNDNAVERVIINVLNDIFGR
jgi:hypothetical protein